MYMRNLSGPVGQGKLSVFLNVSQCTNEVLAQRADAEITKGWQEKKTLQVGVVWQSLGALQLRAA